MSVAELTRGISLVSRSGYLISHQIDRASERGSARISRTSCHGMEEPAVEAVEHRLSHYESGLDTLTATLVVRFSIVLTQCGSKSQLHTLLTVKQ
jgi:hypothetical protein